MYISLGIGAQCPHEELLISTYNSPIGTLTMASNGEFLNGLWIEGQTYYAQSIGKQIHDAKKEDCEVFKSTKEWLDIYFQGEKPSFTPPLKLIGSEFRLQVWNILLRIPYGEVTTYANIAKEIVKFRCMKKMSSQAIGGAVGHNPISIIVPCHRVIGSDGSLTGYAGGIDKKQWLLNLENRKK